jgi:hypothetical protein
MTITMPGKDVPVRLVSYLTTHAEKDSTTCVLGVRQITGQAPMLVLRHLSQAKDDTTTFYVDSQADPIGIRLYWGKDRSMFIVWGNVKDQCFLSNAKRQLVREASIFPLEGAKADPWFTLNDWEHRFALDVAAGKTDDMTPILIWPRNHGDNQIWRLEPIK